MADLPSEREAILRADPYAVSAGLIALQSFQAIAGWNREVFEFGGGVEQLQFPLSASPEVIGDSPGGTRIPCAKQIRRRLVSND
jgi:hypothetical protein